MNGKVAFVMGAAIGYLFGTRAGREQYERIKSGARAALEHPAVRDKVAQAEDKITEAVRTQGAKMTDQVANLVKERFTGAPGPAPRPQARPAVDASEPPRDGWDTPTR